MWRVLCVRLSILSEHGWLKALQGVPISTTQLQVWNVLLLCGGHSRK